MHSNNANCHDGAYLRCYTEYSVAVSEVGLFYSTLKTENFIYYYHSAVNNMSGGNMKSRLEKIISSSKQFASKHKDFLIPAGLMVTSAAADYYFTNLNLADPTYGQIAEGHPLINNAIHYYGKTFGTLIPKAGFTAVVLGVSYAMDKTKHSFKKLKGKHLMYSAAALNTMMALGNIATYII